MGRIVRQIKNSILIVGEGPTERAFLQYLKELFVDRYASISIKISPAFGGSPESIAYEIIRMRSNRDYDKCYMLIDSVPQPVFDSETQKKMNEPPRIEVLLSMPCIEGLFLEILQHKGFSRSGWSSEKCKSEFERVYIHYDKKVEKQAYSKDFTRDRLEVRRKEIKELDKLLSVFET